MKRSASALSSWIADMQVKVIINILLDYRFIFDSWELLLKIIEVFLWGFSIYCLFVSAHIRENHRKRLRWPPFKDFRENVVKLFIFHLMSSFFSQLR
jgi:hypothetical protein